MQTVTILIIISPKAVLLPMNWYWLHILSITWALQLLKESPLLVNCFHV